MARARAGGPGGDHHRYITQLNQHDVLCGRGSGPNERVGNVHFRDLVATRKAEYLAISPRDHREKNRIAREIVETVSSRGGRFLRRVPTAPHPGKYVPGGARASELELYELADEATIMEKAKQALRQNRHGRGGEVVHHGIGSCDKLPIRPAPPPSRQLQNYSAYQAFASRLAQQQHIASSNYGFVSPAEAAGQNLEVQKIVAMQGSPLGGASTAGRGGDFDAGRMFRDARAVAAAAAGVGVLYTDQPQEDVHAMLHYRAQQHRAMANEYHSAAVAARSRKEEAEKEYVDGRLRLEQQRRQAEQDYIDGRLMLEEQRRQGNRRKTGDTGDSIAVGMDPNVLLSESQLVSLETIFAGTSQRTTLARPHSQFHRIGSIGSGAREHLKSAASEHSIEGLEEMSLPSTSIGEISDFSAQGGGGGSHSGAGAAQPLVRTKLGAGGTIVEGMEGGERADSNAEDSEDITMGRGGGSQQDMSKETYPGIHAAQMDRQYYRAVDRVANDLIDSLASRPPPSSSQRRSLSSYYREMRAANSALGSEPRESPPEGFDSMSYEDWQSCKFD